MKKITLALGLMSFIAFTSCKKETTETVEITTPATETVTNDMPPPPPPPIVKDTVVEGTSININSKGVKIDSKDGDNKTKINVSGSDSSIEIKK